MLKVVRGLVIAGVAGALLACGGPRTVPEDQYYRLTNGVDPRSRYTEPVLDGRLVVDGVETAAIYKDRAIVYRDAATPLELRRHHYHHWVDAPARLIQRYLVDHLAGTNVARQVRAARYGLTGEYRLETRLKCFDQIYAEDEVTVEVAMAFVLVDTRSGARLSEFHAEETLSHAGRADMHRTVELFQQALTRLTGRWLNEVDGRLVADGS